MLADFDLGKDIQQPGILRRPGDRLVPRQVGLAASWATPIVDRTGRQEGLDPAVRQPEPQARPPPVPRRRARRWSSRTSPPMALRTAEIPRDKIAGAVKIVRSGGNAADAALPPLKPADAAGAKSVALAGKPVAWSVAPEARRAAPPPDLPADRPEGEGRGLRALPVPGAGLDARWSSSARPGSSASPTRPTARPDGSSGSTWPAGRALGRVELPNVVRPDRREPRRLGAAAPRGQDPRPARRGRARPTASPSSAGGRYEKESGDDRAVAWAAFLDANAS